MAITIKLRRTNNQLSTVTEVPKQGEAVYGLTDNQLVIGDGSNQVKNLPRFYAKTWQGDVIAAAYGGTGNNSGYIRAGLAGGTTAGANSTAEGSNTQSTGQYSHTEGLGTIAKNKSQHVFGEYNTQDPSSNGTTSKGTYVEIVGNGTGTSARSNARTLDWNGNEIVSGKITVGQGPVNNMDVATKLYVDNGLATKQESLPSSSTTNQSLVSISNGFEWKNINTTLQSSTAATSSAAQKLKVTVLGVASSELELSKASTSLYGVTKLSSTVSSTEEGLAATPKGVSNAVSNAINELDVSAVGVAAGTGNRFISQISETDGKISATLATATIGSATQPIWVDGGTLKAGTYSIKATLNNATQYGVAYYSTTTNVTSTAAGAANTALMGKGSAAPAFVSVSPSISVTAGTSSAAPKINVTVLGVSGTAQALTTASTSLYGVTKLSSSASSTEEGLAATPKGVNTAVTNAINALDYTNSNGAVSKTPTNITQTDGKIAVTYSNIGSLNTSVLTAGTLGVARGGTGAASFNTNNLILSNTSSTGALKTLTGGGGGQVLMSTGANSVPVWADIVSNFLSSPDLDSQYLWDIIQTASGSYNALIRDLSGYWISTSKKYVHCFTTCTGASATTVTLGGTYSSGTVSDSTSVAATKYFYMSTSSTKPTSAVSVNDVYYTPNGASIGMAYKSGDTTKYIHFYAYKVYCLSNAGVSIETVVGSSNQYTQAKTSTSVTLNRGTLRQILLGGRTGCYVGNGSSTLNLSLSWIPRLLLISGYIGSSSRTISAMFDLHNVSANSYNPVQTMSYAPPDGGTTASSPNFNPSWYISSSKIAGITLSSAGNLNLSGVVYQYFAIA